MPDGFGRSGGFGRGSGGGMGFGFRGASPPWPYVGRGRGGLPRCGYYGQPAAPFTPRTTGSDDLDYLRNQAEAIKGQLDQIESQIRDLESKQK